MSSFEHRPPHTVYRKNVERVAVHDEVMRKHLRMYEHAAQERGIRAVCGGVWCKADGMRYITHGKEYTIEYNTDGITLPPSRLEKVGIYDHNNGMLAYVDQDGTLWVGRSTEENFSVLHEAGYRPGSLWVPFSNSERILDADDRRALLDTRTGKHREALHHERLERIHEIQQEYALLFGQAAVIPSTAELLHDQRERPAFDRPEYYIERTLQPQKEQDIQHPWIQHTLYTFEGKTFAFQQPQETAQYTTSERSSSRILGKNDAYIEKEYLQKYALAIEQSTEKTTHFHVIASLQGIVELAAQFNPNDSSLPQLAEELHKQTVSPRALALADAYIALAYGNTHYPELHTEPESHAAAALCLALSGVGEIQRVIIERLAQMRRHDIQQKEKLYEKLDNEPLHIQELIVTHATQYAPQETAEGLIVSTTYDATHGKYARNSIHTALNHRVTAHGYGSWDSAAYTLLAPLSEMITHNGAPRSLVTVDTYWTRNPGEPLLFPHGVLVGPGSLNQQELMRIEGKKVYYKPRIGQKDIPELVAYITKHRGQSAIRDLQRGIYNAYTAEYSTDFLSMDALRTYWNIDKLSSEIRQALEGADALEMLQKSTRHSLFNTTRNFLHSLNVRHLYTGPADHYETHIERCATLLAERVAQALRQSVHAVTIDVVITQLGYTTQPGGSWAWGDSWHITAQTRSLAADLRTHAVAHTHMPEHHIADHIVRAQASFYPHDHAKSFSSVPAFRACIDNDIPRLDPATRRMYAHAGYMPV